MTPQQIEMALETIALVLEDLKKTQEKQQATITSIKEELAEHAMREVQRLGQEIEQAPYSVQQAYSMAQVCLDLHEAIGCKWGDNPYLTISQLKTSPPQRKPLTEQEIGAILEDINAFGTRLYTFARAIEDAHGIKGDA